MGGGWLSEISCTDSGDLARALRGVPLGVHNQPQPQELLHVGPG